MTQRSLTYKNMDIDALYQGVISCHIPTLSKAITLIESTKEEHHHLASELVQRCLPHTGNSRKIGISGSPGVGKSTFIESFGSLLAERNHKLAVLTIDPSSQLTKGSILGDKTRMELLTKYEKVFIRPSASGTTLGGVARKTREASILCEAAGFDYIFIETVGVGQSEVAVRQMVDCFLLLLLPGAGDDLQGIKKGIMEMADIVLINKSDGPQKDLAQKTVGYYKSALHLMRGRDDEWAVPVATCSAITNEGIQKAETLVAEYFTKQKETILFQRKKQAAFWFESSLIESLKEIFFNTEGIRDKYQLYKEQVGKGEISAFRAVDLLINFYQDKQQQD